MAWRNGVLILVGVLPRSMLRPAAPGQAHSNLARGGQSCYSVARVRRPSPIRTVTAVLGLSFAAGTFGCDTDAIGVSECRQIEESRCTAATACGFADEASCRSYYRGHCLHGLAVEVVDASDVEDCVQDIETAGACARDQGAETAPSSCSSAVAIVGREVSVCDLVRQPERLQSCAFLGELDDEEEEEPEPTGDAGG